VHRDPLPRLDFEPYRPVRWPDGPRRPLPTRNAPLPVDLSSLLEERQTRRDFTSEVSDTDLGDLLWLTCRSRSSRQSPFGPDQESRPHPSAGAMHPIHVLVSREDAPWSRYDPVEHALVQILDTHGNAAQVRRTAAKLVEVERGVLIALVAEPGKTAAKYENPESLVWRDAGVVLGYLSIVAEALGLAFCPLGITADEYLAHLSPTPGGLHGAGVAILGGSSVAR
jgi:SagB-type dehydrogenase family enzyme